MRALPGIRLPPAVVALLGLLLVPASGCRGVAGGLPDAGESRCTEGE